jgi:hypothetical protein
MKLLLSFFQFIFGCRHRHKSRVFTIKRRTYWVCFDCGREFDLPAADAQKGSGALLKTSLRGNLQHSS